MGTCGDSKRQESLDNSLIQFPMPAARGAFPMVSPPPRDMEQKNNISAVRGSRECLDDACGETDTPPRVKANLMRADGKTF